MELACGINARLWNFCTFRLKKSITVQYLLLITNCRKCKKLKIFMHKVLIKHPNTFFCWVFAPRKFLIFCKCKFEKIGDEQRILNCDDFFSNEKYKSFIVSNWSLKQVPKSLLSTQFCIWQKMVSHWIIGTETRNFPKTFEPNFNLILKGRSKGVSIAEKYVKNFLKI